MITLFKIFEEKKSQIWVIPLKLPDFIISLEKIGMVEKDISRWMHLHKIEVFTDNGRYPDRETITMSKENGNYTWYWYPSTKGDEYTKFMGRLKITSEEIQNYYDKIEFQKDVEKYNV